MDDRELLKTVMAIVGEENCRDDCAVLPCGDQVMVATTDMLHKTTDFVDGMTDWQIGWMSAAVTISDIASMGAAPKYVLIAVGLSQWELLAREGVTAMMDDSDGIALSLYDLMSVNACGFSLDPDALPLPPGIPEFPARELALYGGGDYELIFTLAPDRYPVPGVPCRVIGTAIPEKAVLAGGKPVEKRGYQHRWA